MPTLIVRPWLLPTRLSLVLKAAREGLAAFSQNGRDDAPSYGLAARGNRANDCRLQC
jgi:hypothetical protein